MSKTGLFPLMKELRKRSFTIISKAVKKLICPICHKEVQNGYLFKAWYPHPDSYNDYCGHGCCLTCGLTWFKFMRSQRRRKRCPFCRRHVYGCDKYVNLCLIVDHEKGGKFNPILLDGLVDEAAEVDNLKED